MLKKRAPPQNEEFRKCDIDSNLGNAIMLLALRALPASGLNAEFTAAHVAG